MINIFPKAINDFADILNSSTNTESVNSSIAIHKFASSKLDLSKMKRKESKLLKERKLLANWYKLTKRVELKKAIRQEIAQIDRELKSNGFKK